MAILLTGAGSSSVVFDADAQVYFNQVVTNGGADLSYYWKVKLNTWFINAKANGYFTELDILFSFFNEHQIAACTSLVNPSQAMATLTNNTQFTTFYGITTAGNPDTIDTKYTPRNGIKFTQNSAFMGSGIQNNVAAPGEDFGVFDGANYIQMYSSYGDGFAYYNINDASGNPNVANASNLDADYIMIRNGANSVDCYKNNTILNHTTEVSTNTPNARVFVGAFSNNNSGTTFKAATYTWWGAGSKNINVAQFRADLTA